MRTDEPRQGRNAATVVCSAFAVVPLAFSFLLAGDAKEGCGRILGCILGIDLLKSESRCQWPIKS